MNNLPCYAPNQTAMRAEATSSDSQGCNCQSVKFTNLQIMSRSMDGWLPKRARTCLLCPSSCARGHSGGKCPFMETLISLSGVRSPFLIPIWSKKPPEMPCLYYAKSLLELSALGFVHWCNGQQPSNDVIASSHGKAGGAAPELLCVPDAPYYAPCRYAFPPYSRNYL